MLNAVATWVTSAVRSAGWAPITVFVVHAIASRGFDLYADWPWLDTPMHLVGGVAIAYFFARSLTVAGAEPVLGVLSSSGRGFVAFSFVCTSTIVWEFAEWASDRIGWTQAQRGVDDTMLDMALGITGGVVYLLASRWRSSRAGTVR